MSSLWTPGGERPVSPRPEAAPSAEAPPTGPGGTAGPGGEGAGESPGQEELAEARRQILEAPIEMLIANHCYGLFELAALHLSNQPPNFAAARLAIDAMAGVVEGLEGRLGEAEEQLREGLAQIRLAFVQLQAAAQPQ